MLFKIVDYVLANNISVTSKRHHKLQKKAKDERKSAIQKYFKTFYF